MPWRRTGEWRYSSNILDLDSWWRWVVSFASRPLYSKGKSASYPRKRKLGGLWSKVFCPCRKSKLRPSRPQPVAITFPENLKSFNLQGDNCKVCRNVEKLFNIRRDLVQKAIYYHLLTNLQKSHAPSRKYNSSPVSVNLSILVCACTYSQVQQYADCPNCQLT
jgi:hypothetical protein